MPEFRDAVRARLSRLNLPPARQAEIVEELAQYLEDRSASHRADGRDAAEAERLALDELSDGRALAAAISRVEAPAGPEPVPAGGASAGRGLRGLAAGLWQDGRYAVRALRMNPGLSLVAIVTLALGIGANAAMFQLLNVVTLRALPVQDPSRLTEVRIEDFRDATGHFTGRHIRLTYALWEQIEQHADAFEDLFAWGTGKVDLANGGESHDANVLWVTGGFFRTLGVRPIAGRVLGPGDDQPGCGSPAVVLSHAFWTREYGGDPGIVGRTVTLSNQPFTVAGVAPPGFFGIEVGWQFDVAAPLCAEALVAHSRDAFNVPSYWWLAAIGRLKPGVTAAQATAELAAASPAIFRATLPASYQAADAKTYLGYRLAAFPSSTGVSNLRRAYETPLWLLLGMTGLVLLIACANLANLLLARASAREREMATRLALGASRARLLRQLLVESLLLALLGAAAGVLVAAVVSRGLVTLIATTRNGYSLPLGLDWRVLAFTGGLGALTCLLVGLVPALRATAATPVSAMRAQGRGLTAGRERLVLRRVLVVVQVALSLVLVIGAALFVRTFRNLTTVDLGFRRAGVLTAEFGFGALAPSVPQRAVLHDRVLAALGRIPGVTGAASAAVVQGTGSVWNEQVKIDDEAVPRGLTNVNEVSSSYLQTMQIQLVGGRQFDDHDSPDTPKVAMVSRAFVQKYLAGRNALGHTFRFEVGPGEQETTYQIVGVMADTKYDDVRGTFDPLVYLDARQDHEQGLGLSAMVVSSLPPALLTKDIVAAVGRIDPRISMTFRPLEQQLDDSMMLERAMALLSGLFGVLAALIATVGLYGVIAYSVAKRRHEIGIRMALGADRVRLLRMIVGEAARLLASGLLAGAVIALAAGRAIQALLYGLTPSDPGTFAAATLGLAAITLAASYWPARRAARLDPMCALREE